MADGIEITAGAGTKVVTDDCGVLGHAQVIKIAYSADGDATLVTADANGLKVDASGTSVPVTDAGGSLTVDGTVAISGTVAVTDNAGSLTVDNGGTFAVQAAQSGTWTVQPGNTANTTAWKVDASSVAVPITDNSGSVTVDAPVATPVFVRLSDGAAAISALPVTDNAGSLTVDNAGTFAVQVDGSALTALQLIDDPVFADDAAFTVGTSKVNMTGGLAVAHSANPDAADALDAVALITNRHRVLFTIGGHPNVVTLKHTTITTAVTDAAIVTISTGSKIVVTRLSVTLDSASTVYPSVIIGFGTANTPTTTGVLASHGGVPAGGGFTIGDGSGILGIGADNEDLRVTTTGNATGNGLHITVSYYTIDS